MKVVLVIWWPLFDSSPLQNDGWKTILSFWEANFLGGRTVKLQVGSTFGRDKFGFPNKKIKGWDELDLYFPTKWGAKGRQNPQNLTVKDHARFVGTHYFWNIDPLHTLWWVRNCSHVFFVWESMGGRGVRIMAFRLVVFSDLRTHDNHLGPTVARYTYIHGTHNLQF